MQAMQSVTYEDTMTVPANAPTEEEPEEPELGMKNTAAL